MSGVSLSALMSPMTVFCAVADYRSSNFGGNFRQLGERVRTVGQVAPGGGARAAAGATLIQPSGSCTSSQSTHGKLVSCAPTEILWRLHMELIVLSFIAAGVFLLGDHFGLVKRP